MGIKKVFIIILLFFIIPYLYAQEIGLADFITTNNFIYQWSPFLDTGELKYGSDSFRFKVGEGYIVYNYKEKIDGFISRKNGSLKLDKKTADMILQKTGFSSGNPSSSEITSKNSVNDKNLRPSGYRVAAILIDPGHGGKDPGAIGRHDVNGKSFVINEKDIVLDIALELNKKLVSTYKDKKIILSRNNDSYITHEDRVEKGNSFKLDKNEAIIMVSIHANASLNKNAKGFEVWYLPPDYRRQLIDVTTVDKKTKDILPILNSMLEEEFTIESMLLAQNILDGLGASLGEKELIRGLKEEIWFVVRNAKMPSVLIEVGFVSNKEEAQKLANKAYLKKITEGIYNGIKSFIDNFETITFAGER
ncbi:MAG: N-acetylmuramoyl-L-alanine amidase [Spirochaetaceae bacterium]|nr:N-acetylmuramoyl-L-alanine amidase [Spirochaetaceae bacterium]